MSVISRSINKVLLANYNLRASYYVFITTIYVLVPIYLSHPSRIFLVEKILRSPLN